MSDQFSRCCQLTPAPYCNFLDSGNWVLRKRGEMHVEKLTLSSVLNALNGGALVNMCDKVRGICLITVVVLRLNRMFLGSSRASKHNLVSANT